MDQLTATPKLLKQANLSSIRKVIRAKGTATRAEIVQETKISSTTVRSLLSEMLCDGEIESIGYDESSGGRKALRYSLNPERYHGAAFCISDNQVHSLLVNICGEIVETSCLGVDDGDYEQAIVSYMEYITKRMEIRSIGIGVPGIVDGTSYWKMNPENGKMVQSDIGERLSKRYKIPVILENDLNATTLGFGQCYITEFPGETPENLNMAYLKFEKGCLSAGFIAGGQIIRGCNNYAGELGLVPFHGRPLDDWLSESVSDTQYIDIVVQTICWICGILNPQYLILGGPALRKECMGPIGDQLFGLLGNKMFAEILYSSDSWQDYHQGMAYLTAGRLFGEIQFINLQNR